MSAELDPYDRWQLATKGDIITENKVCYSAEEYEAGMLERDREESSRQQREELWLRSQEN